MAQFDNAVDFVLENEKGLFFNAKDPGGITNHGISLRFLRSVSEKNLKRASILEPVTEQTIRDLTIDQAVIIYRAEFWETAPFEKIINQKLANYIFDMCVQLGICQGIKLTQRAINATQEQKDFVKDDGVLGPVTLQGINQCSFKLCGSLISQRDGFYRRLIHLNKNNKEFFDGWLNRAYRI